MSDDGIAAIVVSHRSIDTIDACLDHLRAARDVVQIRVIDNRSDDGTMERVQRHAAADSRVHFVANPDNPGFAVACNQGANNSDAPWLAFVNPDLMVPVDALARLRDDARLLGEALVGADLVDEAGDHDPAARRRDPDFAAMLRMPAMRNLAIPSDGEPLQRVAAISGALMLMPRTLFERIGGFDPAYRLHAEDLDLCRRAHEAGAIVAIDNSVVVTHLRGVSSRSRPVFVEWHKHRGLWRYFRKFDAAHHRPLTRLAVFAMIWARFPIATLRALARS
ncbi:glycosyltransferase family 2 protein [Solilutibacter silvestris]|uniref:Putative glycosyltransferase n=1 Tax=Solilutibacter silvestris TaxID=1645665 RepID=A0A2K1Q2I8_9GAMM|nr:glycosyltransferase family 2 protein [Lysobacter silvestris]PNS09256.1 putative glycosyltransferase [Lysobacter silvestris]